MKSNYIIAFSIFIIIYSIAFIFFLFEINRSHDIIIHLIFSVVGMICLVILNLKEKSNFILFFTIVSFLFYFFDSFFPISYGLVKGENLLINNAGFLSNTEGFIMFSCAGYIIVLLSKKNKK